LRHSGAFVSTPAPATAVSVTLDLDHDIHILFAKVIHCPLANIFQIRPAGGNHVNHSEDFLGLVFMRMIVVVTMVMTMAMIMAMSVAMIVMVVAMVVSMSTIAMARMIMSMVMT
jgi:hypothetical protein